MDKLKNLPHVKEVRGMGLMIGVEFDDTIGAVDVKHGAFDRKLLITAIGSHVIRMVPPLMQAEKIVTRHMQSGRDSECTFKIKAR